MNDSLKTPFAEPLSDYLEASPSFESRVKEFKNNKNYLVKEITPPPEFKTAAEITQYAQQRFGRGLKLMKDNGLGEYLPETQILVGPDQNGQPKIYIIQKKVDGLELYHVVNDFDIRRNLSDKIVSIAIILEHCKREKQSIEDHDVYKNILKDPNFILLLKTDDLFYKSVLMWQKSYESKRTSDDPVCLSEEQHHRQPCNGEGMFPEISKKTNIMVGQGKNDEQNDSLYLVDIGICTGNFKQFRDTITYTINRQFNFEWNSIRHCCGVDDIADIPDEICQYTPIKAMVLLKRLERKYLKTS